MINLEDEDLYLDENPDRTKIRMKTLAELGCEDVGIYNFGIKGVFSGLYIERVWHMTDAEFNDYVEWVKELKQQKN